MWQLHIRSGPGRFVVEGRLEEQLWITKLPLTLGRRTPDSKQDILLDADEPPGMPVNTPPPDLAQAIAVRHLQW